MKLKFLLIMIAAALGARAPLHAQTDLAIAEFFTPEFQNQVGVTAVDMYDAQIEGFWDELPVYRSVTVTDENLSQRINDAVKKDGLKAKARTVSMDNGKIKYGWYNVPTASKNKLYAYIIYITSDPKKETASVLIYLETTYDPSVFKRFMLNNLPASVK